MWIRVRYTHTPYHSDTSNKMVYKIKLETTQPNYGGNRFWFVCPITQRRAGILFLPQGFKWFASRHAFNLNYQSQSRSVIDRALDKKWALIRKVNEGGNYWCKPKGMHCKTHEQMIDEIHKAEEICDNHLLKYYKNLGAS